MQHPHLLTKAGINEKSKFANCMKMAIMLSSEEGLQFLNSKDVYIDGKWLTVTDNIQHKVKKALSSLEKKYMGKDKVNKSAKHMFTAVGGRISRILAKAPKSITIAQLVKEA